MKKTEYGARDAFENKDERVLILGVPNSTIRPKPKIDKPPARSKLSMCFQVPFGFDTLDLEENSR